MSEPQSYDPNLDGKLKSSFTKTTENRVPDEQVVPIVDQFDEFSTVEGHTFSEEELMREDGEEDPARSQEVAEAINVVADASTLLAAAKGELGADAETDAVELFDKKKQVLALEKWAKDYEEVIKPKIDNQIRKPLENFDYELTETLSIAKDLKEAAETKSETGFKQLATKLEDAVRRLGVIVGEGPLKAELFKTLKELEEARDDTDYEATRKADEVTPELAVGIIHDLETMGPTSGKQSDAIYNRLGDQVRPGLKELDKFAPVLDKLDLHLKEAMHSIQRARDFGGNVSHSDNANDTYDSASATVAALKLAQTHIQTVIDVAARHTRS